MSSNINSSSGDIINIHFDENRKRQGLTSTIIGNAPPESSTAAAAAIDDKSRKGSIDTRIAQLVQMINNNHVTSNCPSSNWNYFTTSSCSGRIILFTHGEDNNENITDTDDQDLVDSPSEITSKKQQTKDGVDTDFGLNQFRKTGKKKGCKWLYVTHNEIENQEFLRCWQNLPDGSYAVFKVEPSIFHVQCRTLSSAKELIHIATQSGFRNSGMVIGKDGKITVAIRSTIGLEVPLPIGKSDDVTTIVSQKFLQYLIDTANQTMDENWKRTEKLTSQFQQCYSNKACNLDGLI